MIPKQLTLKNFLSYREVTLNFDGLHVACVCGANGAGKSSLLEAIAWCVWGQSRVSAEDDIIRQGAREAQVSFCFEHSGQCYRIIRTRRRNQASALEFQLEIGHADDGRVDASLNANVDASVETNRPKHRFRSLTQRGVRATQQYILQQLKIDYDTFVNAAYLRQGRADEFMLKGPSDRKQVLADLLKLDHYDSLAEQAKEQARQYKAQIYPIEMLLDRLAQQIATKEETQAAYQSLKQQIEAQKKRRQQQKRALTRLKKQQQQILQWQQQLVLARQQQQHQQEICQATQTALNKVKQHLAKVEGILAQSETIQKHTEQLIQLRQSEEQQAEQFQLYQEAQTQRLQLQQQLGTQQQAHTHQITQIETQLSQLQMQASDIQQTLAQRDEIIGKVERLKVAKKELRQLDKMEAQSAPLRQQLRQLESQIIQAQTRLITRIEELDNRQSQIATQQTQAPQLMQAAVDVSHRIAYLEQRRDYQEALRQKGLERRGFMERLQANQLNYEVQLERFDRTLQLLEDPDAARCPVCEQPLKGHDWQVLRDRTLQERDDVQNQIWAIREQLAVSESEIQVLRQEYRVLEEELAKYAPILEERGQLKAKLASADTLQDRLQEMSAERAQLERCLQENDYAEGLQGELERVQAQIAAMNYDDRNHALLRSQVNRLRWSELKYAEIKQAEKRLQQIQAERPKLEAALKEAKSILEQLAQNPVQQALAEIEQRLNDTDYSPSQHNAIRAQLRQADIWQAKYQALQQAQDEQGGLLEQLEQLTGRYQTQTTEAERSALKVSELQQQLATCSDPTADIAELEADLANYQETRDRHLSQLGRLQQQLSQLDSVQAQHGQQQQKLEDIRHKYQVYKALAEALGRKGIQALMIENLLPQLEAETNQILGRLSNHQLHVQFVTQRAGRRSKKLIDTLDILIADARGTRPYETYSGGEAFRVNFSIRLAIARLLAMRSGTALQMLIVDEGFGTQDREGCDRLIAAIEAIAPDFACILTITHMPHFREAFQTRIDVSKDEQGSHITISG
ncbi:MAG: SMC family ATPase [Cyanobacteria bacterium P01_F01_bin.53]